MRFEGSLNVDLNEITTNLVPYPKMHYLISRYIQLTEYEDTTINLLDLLLVVSCTCFAAT